MPVSAPTPSKPTTARGRRTRQALLSASEHVFGVLGFERASIVAITQRAKVALGSFYTYFPSKEAVFSELVQSLSLELRTQVTDAVGDERDRVEAERKALFAFFAFIRAHRALYRVVRQAEFVDEELYRRWYTSVSEGYVRGLEAAMAEGQIARRNPEAVAFCLMGIADFVGMRWVLWEDRLPPDDVIDAVLAFIRGGLTPTASEQT